LKSDFASFFPTSSDQMSVWNKKKPGRPVGEIEGPPLQVPVDDNGSFSSLEISVKERKFFNFFIFHFHFLFFSNISTWCHVGAIE